ncbi:hypothetical protein [Streptomyces antimicrobicus]|uniref:Lipoprotein n=1 Tax=Streptomyces antimicrobicus TaxID=2883108 RepID=A0ABS8BE46_9ACTN|nr:hypothetical protein [Streptomyces antimicrobicus]MCB5182916.1 hypothetical protein [Streptomyces antimicrobicus]
MRARLTAVVAAAATTAVLAVAGCRITVEEHPSSPTHPTTHPTTRPLPLTTGPASPYPKGPDPERPVTSPPPTPWVPKGPATLVGCGSHASGHACTFRGYGFKPGERVRLTRGTSAADVGGHVFTADKNGGFRTDLVSNTPSGLHPYAARGLTSGREARTQVRITPGLWG